MIKKENRNLDCVSADNLFMIDCGNIFLREFRLEDLDELYSITLQQEIRDYMPTWKGTREQYQDWVPNMYIKNNKEYLRAIPNVENHPFNWYLLCKSDL